MAQRSHVLAPPLSDDDAASLRAGDETLISGVMYSARDAAHERMVKGLENGKPLPFDPVGQIIYYMGPSPAPPGKPIGAAGPTTSYRMDAYATVLYEAGIKATIGKGPRSDTVREAIRRCRALYLAAVGGAGALLALRVKSCEVIAYPELGPEAVCRLVVEDFPTIVINDIHGGDAYAEATPGKPRARPGR